MGLPLLAKNTGIDHPTPSHSSKAGDKAVLKPSAAALAKAKQQSHKEVVTVTPDVSRGAVSPTLLAKQQAAAHGPVSTSLAAKQTAAVSQSRVATHEEHAAAPSSSSPVIRNSQIVVAGAFPIRIPSGSLMLDRGASSVSLDSDSDRGDSGQRFARVTAYWAGEGDYYTGRCMSSTGVRLHDGHCAVDPSIIPYGSVVEISGVGKFLAVDTGSAVINRTAAREGGHTDAERHAIVVDLFFEDRSEGERFAAGAAKYVAISWWTPSSMGIEAKAARGLFAEEDWTKIQGKQL